MAILTNSTDFVGAGTNTWQQYLKQAVRTAQQLAELLEIPVDSICRSQAESEFPLLVPEPFLKRIQTGDSNDPLLLQVLPQKEESIAIEGYSDDPLREQGFDRGAGVLQKYDGRALLVVNGSCAVHCRYCFRRSFPYSQSVDVGNKWKSAIADLAADDTIEEVILSGGDPLTLVDAQFRSLVQRLEEVSHLQRLRIHSRLPIVIPQRVTDALLEVFSETRFDVVFVIHSNHANEFDGDVVDACRRLSDVSEALLNQSVLLRGVNDDLKSLMELSRRLISSAVVPYYLHKLDPVAGAAHFEVSVERGVDLVNQMRASLPGYMVPRFVQEIPGRPNKTVLA